jgi:hypothetical protein
MRIAKGKIFATDPVELQKIIDSLLNTFGELISVSTINEAPEGDYFVFVNFFNSRRQNNAT